MTKPNHEAIAAENLRRQNYEFYYPKFLQKRPNKTPLIRPLFPRYIFVLIERTWYSLCGTRGISTVLLGDNGPAILPTQVISALRDREDKSGLVQLRPPPRFATGTKVRTDKGPLMGLDLLYDGQLARDRCHVLASLLGMKVVVELDEKSLVAA